MLLICLVLLKRGLIDLDIDISYSWCAGFAFYSNLRSEIFVSDTLVRLKIRVTDGFSLYGKEDVVSLPKLKSLHLHRVYTEESKFAKFLSGCPELEEAVLVNMVWKSLSSFSVTNTTLKRLKFHRQGDHLSSNYMSFDLPNLVYLEYYDVMADEYPLVRFDSLVEASLGIRLDEHDIQCLRFSEEIERVEGKIVTGDVTGFLMGVCNVKILYLSDDILHVLNYGCETVPMFHNLVHLTIKTHEDFGWKSVASLLEKSPILETLVFQGLHHKCKVICEDEYECICKSWVEDERNVPTCLSASPVKVLKIQMVFNDIEAQVDQVKYFLETMPNLEQMILSGVPSEEDVIKVSRQLHMLPKVASSKCKIQVTSDNLS